MIVDDVASERDALAYHDMIDNTVSIPDPDRALHLIEQRLRDWRDNVGPQPHPEGDWLVEKDGAWVHDATFTVRIVSLGRTRFSFQLSQAPRLAGPPCVRG